MPLQFPPVSRSLLARGLVAAVVVASAVAAFAASGVQITPDRNRTLVSKDLAGERWAITCEEDGTISGNVFRPDADNLMPATRPQQRKAPASALPATYTPGH